MRWNPHLWLYRAGKYLKLPKKHPHSYDNCPLGQLDTFMTR